MSKGRFGTGPVTIPGQHDAFGCVGFSEKRVELNRFFRGQPHSGGGLLRRRADVIDRHRRPGIGKSRISRGERGIPRNDLLEQLGDLTRRVNTPVGTTSARALR